MNIAILSQGASLYSTKSILKAGELRQHTMEVIDPTYCNVLLENGKAILQYHDEIIDDLDAVIPRIGASNTYYGSSIVRHFETMNVFSVSTAQGILQSRDKWASLQILARAGVPIPKTTLCLPVYAEDFLKDFGDNPVVIKLLEGTHGEGVILSETYQNALATIETLHALETKFLLQEFIKESKGTDIRVIVVNNKVVASMKRKAKNGDFRSNLHRGGSSEVIQLTQEEEEIAIKAAKALGLGVCGVDILPSKKGPLVLEVNSTPGLEGIEKTTSIDIAKAIITFIEENKR